MIITFSFYWYMILCWSHRLLLSNKYSCHLVLHVCRSDNVCWFDRTNSSDTKTAARVTWCHVTRHRKKNKKKTPGVRGVKWANSCYIWSVSKAPESREDGLIYLIFHLSSHWLKFLCVCSFWKCWTLVQCPFYRYYLWMKFQEALIVLNCCLFCADK